MKSTEIIYENINRRKKICTNILSTKLNRCLTTFDLTFVGLSYIIGAGVYVLTGAVAAENAGPAVNISILIATSSALLSAVCYAELCCRIPRAGSAYLYAYLTIGEIWAFIIGWSMILEFMAASGSIARALATFIDTVFDDAIRNATVDYLMGGKEWNSPFLASYPDFLAAFMILIFTIIVLFGVQLSSAINNIITVSTLISIFILVTYGSVFIDFSNWTDYGGFFPNGFGGVVSGSAKLFFLYAGFEVICVSSEECETPAKSVPKALVLVVVGSTVVNLVVASTITLLVPWSEINTIMPFPDAFKQMGEIAPTYIVLVGMSFSVAGSILISLHTLPRLVYAMANDGLLFSPLARISSGNQAPVMATVIFGAITMVIVLFINFNALVESLNIGSLLCYTIVSASVIVLRYRPENENATIFNKQDCVPVVCVNEDQMGETSGTLKSQFEMLLFLKSDVPGRTVAISTVVYALCCAGTTALLSHSANDIMNGHWGYFIVFIVFLLGSVLTFTIILMHHQNYEKLSFKVPFVPFIPALAMLCNIVLLVNLSVFTWIRFIAWVFLGLLIYGIYGYHHSLVGISINSSSEEENDASHFSASMSYGDYGAVKLVNVPSSDENSY
ncbi:cationic amino acid transporter 4-like [Anneissia japonica]|uniref:cationic amino acid transporter 4-like n=1 Tax=Anneissia japonica TaxID=1529436 RepID=UPI0014255B17|nr:cationic amino acid transporter 4-like [Anneissia japonica]XP_033098359.1 cationic amino acid transporter 4-like [Anneissia japonica]